jgi:hypothetical protein
VENSEIKAQSANLISDTIEGQKTKSSSPNKIETATSSMANNTDETSEILNESSSRLDAMESMPNDAATTVRSYIYALGRVEARFPSIGLEKEFAQVAGESYTGGMTDRQALHAIISQSENRYIARKMCWFFSIEGIETYILQPCCGQGFDMLVQTLRPAPRPTDVDVVIGVRGSIAPAEMCNGLMVPIVIVDQTYSFDIDELIKSIPKPKKMTQKDFAPAAEELFFKVLQMADNAGSSDEDRALNYLAVRYHAIYATAAEMFQQDYSLTSMDVRPSRLSGIRKILDVIFSYTNRQTDVTVKYFVRVDVTEEFPFLVTKLSPYYDR